MKTKIEARIKDYKRQIDGGFTDNIMKCKVVELEWVLSLFEENEPKNKYLMSSFSQKDRAEVFELAEEYRIDRWRVYDFVSYRKQIKKPCKTIRPIKSYIKKLADATKKGYRLNDIIRIMQDNEWQTFELDWIEKKLPKINNNCLAEFGFNTGATNLLE